MENIVTTTEQNIIVGRIYTRFGEKFLCIGDGRSNPEIKTILQNYLTGFNKNNSINELVNNLKPKIGIGEFVSLDDFHQPIFTRNIELISVNQLILTDYSHHQDFYIYYHDSNLVKYDRKTKTISRSLKYDKKILNHRVITNFSREDLVTIFYDYSFIFFNSQYPDINSNPLIQNYIQFLKFGHIRNIPCVQYWNKKSSLCHITFFNGKKFYSHQVTKLNWMKTKKTFNKITSCPRLTDDHYKIIGYIMQNHENN